MFNGSCFREGITRPGVKRDHMEAVCQAVGQTSQSPLAGGVKEIFHLQYRELTLPEKVSDLWCFHKLFIVIFTFYVSHSAARIPANGRGRILHLTA